MKNLIEKSDVLEAYADLYDIFDDNKAIQKELDKVFDKINNIPTVESNSSKKPNNCETCRFELYCPEMCEGCCEWDSHYEPKDEPQTRMTEDDAFYIVFKDLTKDEGLFTGKYDAKHGNKHYMYGINSVMEYIAYRVGEDCFNAFNEHFTNNMVKSEKAKEQNNE